MLDYERASSTRKFCFGVARNNLDEAHQRIVKAIAHGAEIAPLNTAIMMIDEAKKIISQCEASE